MPANGATASRREGFRRSWDEIIPLLDVPHCVCLDVFGLLEVRDMKREMEEQVKVMS